MKKDLLAGIKDIDVTKLDVEARSKLYDTLIELEEAIDARLEELRLEERAKKSKMRIVK